MSKTDYVYAHHQDVKKLPEEVAAYLDGTGLLAKTQALRVSTVDAAGWPHASLLSVGEVLALPSGKIRFAIFPAAGAAANLARDGRLALTLSLGGGMTELRMRARPLANPDADIPLAFFEAELEAARTHVAPYASVTSGVTFSLHEPEAIVARWERQIAALRAAN